MATAHRLLHGLLSVVAPYAAVVLGRACSPAQLCAAGCGIAHAAVPPAAPHDMLVWHLMHQVRVCERVYVCERVGAHALGGCGCCWDAGIEGGEGRARCVASRAGGRLHAGHGRRAA